MSDVIKWGRVTKYNPVNRNDKGHYLINEWTSYSDIGKSIGGQILTETEYVRTENLYINAVLYFMEINNVYELFISSLEKKSPPKDKILLPVYRKIENNMYFNKNELSDVIKLNLRENIWAQLKSNQGFEVHFGYDYYMYIGCLFLPKEYSKLKLFIENSNSPYL